MSTAIEAKPVHGPVSLPKPDGFRVISTAVGASGGAIRLCTPELAAETVFSTEGQPGWASFPKTRTDQAYWGTLFVTNAAGETTSRQLSQVSATFPLVQAMPSGETLIVAPRCRHFPDGTFEMNAKIYHLDGSIKSEFCLGDGIEHVQVDREGRIWVGYFDEGVFGNFGWGPGGEAEPLGASGLTCYDASGRILWNFEPPDGFDHISDCYVLNVADDAVWACYYTDFPIVRINSSGHTRGWQSELSGPTALAVSGESVLVYGGYRENRSACSLVQLGEANTVTIAQVKLSFAQSGEDDRNVVIGRDKLLHVFTGDDWYMFSPESMEP